MVAIRAIHLLLVTAFYFHPQFRFIICLRCRRRICSLPAIVLTATFTRFARTLSDAFVWIRTFGGLQRPVNVVQVLFDHGGEQLTAMLVAGLFVLIWSLVSHLLARQITVLTKSANVTLVVGELR